MATLEAKIEALLAVSPRPLSVKKLVELTGEKKEDVRAAAASLADHLVSKNRGVMVVRVDDEYRLGTTGAVTEVVERFIRDETTGELTRPQLETLTVIAYRGPVGKAELEQIRGVNCTLIIRNLLLRGLVDETIEGEVAQYRVSMEFMRFVGAASVADLPDYDKLRRDKRIEDILEATGKE